RIEVDVFSVVLGFVLGPDFLHRQDPLAHQSPSSLEVRAVILHFLDVPASPDSKKESTSGKHVHAGDLFCGSDRISLDDRTDSSPEFEFSSRGRGRSQSYERVVSMPVLFWQIGVSRPRRATRCGNMSVLRQPERFETSALALTCKLVGPDGVVG